MQNEKNASRQSVAKYPQLNDLMPIRESTNNDAIFIKGFINHKPIEFLWDSGATKSLLPDNFFPEKQLKERFRSATGHPIMASAPIMTDFTVNGTPLQIEVHTNNNDLAILGRPFIHKCTAVSDGEKVVRIVYLHNGEETIIYKCELAEN